MKYYIDFDSTLYNTSGLVDAMLKALAEAINKQNKSLNTNDMYLEEKNMLKSKKLYNINEPCEYFADKYNLVVTPLINEVEKVVNNSESFVYPDTIEFLQKLKKDNHTINLITYTAKQGIEYQVQKIQGSGLIKYFDNIIVTSTPKWDLDLDYTTGIFIDDNPDNLVGLYSKNPQNLIRIKREGNKYSAKSMPENINIPEYTDFSQIKIAEVI